MRKPNVLLMPFFCEGYDRSVATQQAETAAAVLRRLGMDVETAEMVCDVAAARIASKAYNPYNYDLAVAFITTWTEPRLACVALRQFFGAPLAVWCQDALMLDGRRIEMSAAPASAALRGCLQEMGVCSELFVGLPLCEKDELKITALANAGRAITMLREAKMGFFGHNFNGITAADMDLSLLRKRLGTEVYTFDCSELIRRMEMVDEGTATQMASRVRARLTGNTGKHFDRIVRMCAALEKYIKEYDLSALNVRCHTELSQTFGLSACLALSILGDSLPCSCEADIPVMLTQLLLHYLSGGMVSAYVDLRTFREDGMDAGACGYAPCSLTGGKALVSGPEVPGNSNPDGYLTNKAAFCGGRVTLARLLKFPGSVLKLHATGATATAMPEQLQEMGCPYYPMTRLKPDVPMERFMEHVGANHYALVYDELRQSLQFFAKYTGIEILS